MSTPTREEAALLRKRANAIKLQVATNAMTVMSTLLTEAVQGYRTAWRAQRAANGAFHRASVALRAVYGDAGRDGPEELRAALDAYNAAASEAELLAVDVREEAEAAMERAAAQLQACASAALKVAAVLMPEAQAAAQEGGLS